MTIQIMEREREQRKINKRALSMKFLRKIFIKNVKRL
jgi:hypothetical protein